MIDSSWNDLDIVEGGRINFNLIVLFHVRSELSLVFSLDAHKAKEEANIVRHLAEFLQALEVCDPSIISKSFHNLIREWGVAEQEPTTWSDTVSLVLELLWPEFIETVETVKQIES